MIAPDASEQRKPLRCCRECAAPVSSRRNFCEPSCRTAFHNRRKRRGAEIYDLVMAMRFDRHQAQDAGAWSLLCRMAARFKAQDLSERGGLRSWEPIEIARKKHTHHSADCIAVMR